VGEVIRLAKMSGSWESSCDGHAEIVLR
jgi:hypothetical protein